MGKNNVLAGPPCILVDVYYLAQQEIRSVEQGDCQVAQR